jgi:MOSC domain-containing protein YiiM
MNNAAIPAGTLGRVASLHLHPQTPGSGLHEVEEVEAVEGMGLSGDHRYFGRKSKETGLPTRRQVSLIEREQVAEHAQALGIGEIAPGLVRSNIETEGVRWVQLVGNRVQVGEAVLHIAVPRDPCAKMDAVCQGLRARMMNDQQGVLAEVLRSGKIRVGDAISLLSS